MQSGIGKLEMMVFWGMTLAAVVLIVHAYVSNAASLEERARIVEECNARIMEVNDELARCRVCFSLSKGQTPDFFVTEVGENET